jgi:levanase
LIWFHKNGKGYDMAVYKFRLCILLILFVFVSCDRSNEPHTIIIDNFESKTYSKWIAEGTAFADGPSRGEDSHRMVGSLGSGFVSSVSLENEPAVGILTSPPFVIERNTIHFLLGAHEVHFLPGTGENPDNLAIQLLIDDKVVRSKTPDEFHAMFWRAWDVSDLKGQTARIRIVDHDKRMWAHIDVDQIVQNDIPVEGIKRYKNRT